MRDRQKQDINSMHATYTNMFTQKYSHAHDFNNTHVPSHTHSENTQ